MGEIVGFDLELVEGLFFKDAFGRLLFDREEVSEAIYDASVVASVYDWSLEGICSYFSYLSPSCWPVTSDLRTLTQHHKKTVLPEWLDDHGLMEILESGKAPKRAEEKLATQLIFETYLALISALQRGELIVKGRDRALADAHVVPASYWHSEFSYVSWRRNELLRIDGDLRQVLAEDLTIFVAQSSKTKRGSKYDNKGRFVEAEVIRFLEALEDQPRSKKAHVREDVLQRFPGVSGRQFDRLWGDYAPQSFKQAGRIPSK
ncbi:hypothetical protein SAMN04488518_1267 [Pseudovibrio ascidiaceicola]|uniref:Uncharacterized protein n=1 Tax=Pseudovibrio ascidiaceicola TaxID=285279 RepID=A0A1I4G2F3_9HYPH|nr:hypothetical protein [Pseudovibrio ascidiaceicola]SFL23883.1 hypothetical protein SAMN04488518_1267 [Pseudovibrio ascidiaceicola]